MKNKNDLAKKKKKKNQHKKKPTSSNYITTIDLKWGLDILFCQLIHQTSLIMLIPGKLTSLKKWQRIMPYPKGGKAISFVKRNLEENAFFRSTVLPS